MDLRAVLLAREERLAGARGVENHVAAPTQDASRDSPHLVVVLDEQ